MTMTIAQATRGEIETLEGQPFRSEWFQVDPDRLPIFDQATYVDDNPNPVDSDLYPEDLIEGFHLLGLLDHLINPVVFIDDPAWSGWNYGFDRVRFVSTVTARERIRVSGHVGQVKPRDKGRYEVLLNCTIEVEGREKPAMVAEWRVVWTRTTEEDS
jgi:hypothetical protein